MSATASADTAIADNSILPSDETDERRLRLERSTLLLVVGVAEAVGGLLTILLSIAGARPENMVYRQIPYVITAIAGSAVFLSGALLIGSYFLWRAFQEVRTLTGELEEAAANVLWSDLVSPVVDNTATPDTRRDAGRASARVGARRDRS